MNLSKSTKMLCAIKETTQEGVAVGAGVSVFTVTRMIHKNVASTKTLEAISKWAEMEVSEFIALGEKND